METFTPTTGEVSRGTFEARSEVPSSSRAGVPYSEGDEFARLLSQERAARKHAERVANTHARSTRVLEVSKTELVRKMLSMKIKMEREEREKSRKQEQEPSSVEVISDMKKQIEVTRNELTESTHSLAEESRRSAIAAQELIQMNNTMRGLEEELRQTKQRLSDTERAKHDVMLRSSSYDKRVRAREALSENRLASAEYQSASAQSLMDKLEERIAYLDRKDMMREGEGAGAENRVPPRHPGGPTTSASKAEGATAAASAVPRSASKFASYTDPDKRAALRSQVLQNVDIAGDLGREGRQGATFAVPGMVENDGDLHMSEARTILVDPHKLDPTVGAHMDYLTFKAFSSEGHRSRRGGGTDVHKAATIHQAQFASKRNAPPSPLIDQTVKDTHAAFAQFSKYRRFQTSDNVNASEKKLSALVNENHQLKVSKEKAEIQHKAAVEELEDMREKLRVTRLENEQFKSTTNNQEQDLITWKVKTFEVISGLDSSIRKVVDDAQGAMESRCKGSVLNKLEAAEKRVRQLSSCVEGLNRSYRRDKAELEEATAELEARGSALEEARAEMRGMEERHREEKEAVAEDLERSRTLRAEIAEERRTLRARYKKEVVGVQASANQALDSFQQKLSEISIKAARVFVEADKKTNAFDDILGERGLEDALKSIAEGVEAELGRLEESGRRIAEEAKAGAQEVAAKLKEAVRERDRLGGELEAGKKEVEAMAAKVEEAESYRERAEKAAEELEELKSEHASREEQAAKDLKEKEEKLQNTMEEASLLLQEVDELTERIVEKEKEVVAIQAKADGATAAREEAEKTLKERDASLKDAEAKAEAMVVEVKELTSRVEEKEKEVDDARESAREAREEAEKAVEERETVSKELEETSSRLQEAETSCEEASKVIVELKQSQEKEMKELAENIEVENKDLQDQVMQHATRVEELEKQVEMEHNEVEAYTANLETIQRRAEEAEGRYREAEERLVVAEAAADQGREETEGLREQLRNANAQKQAAEERTATAISKLYDMESRVEYEKKRAEGVVQVVSQQLHMEGRGQTAALISDFARLRQQLESEVDETKRSELEERLDSLKLAMQYDDADSGKQSTSFMQLENKLQTEKEIRKKLEGELKAALDKCLASEEENQMLLKEYEEVVEENKFLVSQIENLSK